MKKAQFVARAFHYRYVKPALKIQSVYGAFETSYDADYYFSGEFHPFWEFVYVLSGSVNVSGDERVYHLKEGDIIFHKPLEFHRLWTNTEKLPRLFILSFELESAFAQKLENGVFSLQAAQKEKIFALLDFLRNHQSFSLPDAQATYFLDDWENPFVSQNIVNRLEGFLLSLLDEENLSVIREDTREEIRVYKEIIRLLSEHRYDSITLDELAQKCCISKSQLKRLFSKSSSMSIHKYFLKIKMAEAMKRLSEGFSVAEVSEMLSFKSPNYFSTVFKREMGISPLSYKQKKNRP